MKPLSVLPPDLSDVLGAFHRLVECVSAAVVAVSEILVAVRLRRTGGQRSGALPSRRLTIGQIKQADKGWMFMERCNRTGAAHADEVRALDRLDLVLAHCPAIALPCTDC